ncbi:hypothetical protein C8R46DRAFT_1036387 [Mycena filopes]|nr:hypothetical protein C8R46DRAFT_1036387 [Mycena filopes]
MSSVLKIPPADESPLTEIVRLQATSLRGFPHAVISSLHEGPTMRMRWAFGVPAWRGRRVLLIHGSEDDVVEPHTSPLMRSLIDAAPEEKNTTPAETTVVYVEGAGHDLPWTHAEEMGRVVLKFLEGN